MVVHKHSRLDVRADIQVKSIDLKCADVILINIMKIILWKIILEIALMYVCTRID